MNTPKLILFDLDGTLVDSVPDLAFCIDQMMIQTGQPPCGDERVREWVGNGVERLVRRALVGQLEGEPPKELFEQAYPLFMESYRVHNGQRSCLYPGVRETLDRLRASNKYKLACVTNKAKLFTHPLLNALGIEDHFELIISGDSLPKKKPHPLPLLHAAAQFNIKPSRSLMIGDSINDVQAARAAGFNIFCVPYGYNHGQDIHLAKPDAVIDSLLEIEPLLASKEMLKSA